ncbi:sigma factor-like helix-turn-helix DNA-binding protein [Neorhizobium alkalisoli]|uniref:Sigma-70-like protein n=1 Tax=Neorhizobium alkalisoli TaxID=528178 RepID=A0A561Q0N8_9HYPH|nr:sigma-70-like protein [Neorhizobium alkalisoli]
MRNTYYTRYAKSRREHVGISDEMMVMMPVAAGQEWAWRAQELERAFLALTPLYRQALHMIAIEGISYEDAADRCHCPIGTIKSRVNRARFELSRRLDS